MSQLRKLFEPIRVGQLELKNRLVRPGMVSNYGANERMTDRMKNFYTEIARGGVALIVTGAMASMDLGVTPRGLGIYKDEFIPNLRELVRVAHDGGAKIAAQLGAPALWRSGEGNQPEVVGPSDVMVNPRGDTRPRPLTVEEIRQMVDAFGEATRRARDAGFDAVEFHAGVGALINQFISTYTNKRTDEYGGELQSRMRFLLDIIDMARRKAGEDYTLLVRVSGADFMEGGHTLEDTMLVAPILERAGIKAINVTTGWHEAPVPSFHASVPRGAWTYLAEGVKKVVSVPVVTGTRIPDPVLADQILAEGKADLIYMARPLIADPELPNKAGEGRFDDIRPCIACSLCFSSILRREPVVCAVNARAGREGEYRIEPAKEPRKVFVIGGGPAGMEAARVAAMRGHQITLADKNDQLGGLMRAAEVPPYKEEIGYFTKYLAGQMYKLGVDVRLGKEITAEDVEAVKPEVVIIATGATPIIPDISGAKGNNVVTAIDVLTGKDELGEKVAVIGGGMVGCETAEFLAQKGKKVTILEMLGRIGMDIEATNRWVVMQRLRAARVRMETKAKVEEITAKGVRVSRDEGSEFFEVDSVVLAAGMEANRKLADDLKDKVDTLHVIGDSDQPQKMAEAIESGLRIGCTI
ncbi:MAG: FAD-dependent oxidoreductase [Desulfobacteraceae bacterium]|nr:FAD-dependent oxidoreductase [Desulfobacteraceae bacterium]